MMKKTRSTKLSMKQLLDNELRPKMRLSEIEKLIKRHRIVTPPLSRATLNRMCDEGIFDTAGDAPSTLGWLVFEDSFLRWVEGLDRGGKPRRKKAAD